MSILALILAENHGKIKKLSSIHLNGDEKKNWILNLKLMGPKNVILSFSLEFQKIFSITEMFKF